MSYVSEVLADSPLAYWRLEEAAGSSAADSSGNGKTGTYQGSLDLGQAGLITSGLSLHCHGSNAGVLIASAFSLPTATSPFTFEAWIKTTATGTRPIVSGRSNASANANLDFGVNSGKLYVQPRGDNNAGLITLQSPGNVNDGNTHHVVATRTTAKLWTLYIDGASVATQSDGLTSGCTSLDLAYIGKEARNILFMDGTIDEVAVYQSALSSARVLAHYNAGIATATGIKTIMGVDYPGNVKTTVGLAPAKTVMGVAA